MKFDTLLEAYLKALKECDGCGGISTGSVFSGHSGPNDTYAPGDSRKVIDKKKKRKIVRRKK